MDVNDIKNDSIDEGKRLFIPNPYIFNNFSDPGLFKEYFIYPIKSIIARPFGWQHDSGADTYRFHHGIHLQVETNTPVRASMRGSVYDTGNDPIQGKYVILEHGRYYYSLYSNLSDVSVRKGNYVRQGNIIGEAGGVGNGSETYLHFGIFRGYNALNPQAQIEEIYKFNGIDSFIKRNIQFEFDDIEGFIVQTVNDGKAVRIVNYMGGDTVVRIPHTINNLPVKEIEDKVFLERGLAGVTIPDSVTYIGRSAFNTNKLKRLTIPNSVATIDYMAFANNELTNVIIPDSVTTIGEYAFMVNKISRVVIPNGVTAIGGTAFEGNKLTSVTIPDSVTVIENRVFAGNKLRNVTIPFNIVSIGDGAFADNKLRSITIPNSVTSIGNGAFKDNKLKSVVIPDSVTSIEYGAFERNKLKHVTIPDSVTSIEYEAFARNKLRSIIIPSNVISIGAGAFAWNKITQITIGADVTLGKNAFPLRKNIIEGLKEILKQICARKSIISNEWEIKGAFELNFDDFYLANGRKAGTYIYKNGSWNVKTN